MQNLKDYCCFNLRGLVFVLGVCLENCEEAYERHFRRPELAEPVFKELHAPASEVSTESHFRNYNSLHFS